MESDLELSDNCFRLGTTKRSQNQIQCYDMNRKSDQTDMEPDLGLQNEHRIRFIGTKWHTDSYPHYKINTESDLVLQRRTLIQIQTNKDRIRSCATILKGVPQGFFPKRILYAILSEKETFWCIWKNKPKKPLCQWSPTLPGYRLSWRL